MLKKYYKKITTDPLAVFFYAYMAVPLLFIPDNPTLSKTLRLLALIGIFCGAVFVSQSGRSEFITNIRKLSKLLKYSLLIIVLAMAYSSLRAKNLPDTTIFGLAPEYLGLVPWTIFLGLGLLFQQTAMRLFFSKTTLYIFSAVLALSLVSNIFYIAHGFRLSGVMFQPTTMAMYALVGCVLYLKQLDAKQVQKWLLAGLFGLSLCVVMLCQSRVGYGLLVIILATWALRHVQSKRNLAFALTAILLVVAILPQLRSSYFSRFQSDSLSKGIQYRLDLYKTSVPDLARHQVAFGKGPSTLPPALNNQNTVPEEIAVTLHQGYIFSSTHDLYFDFAYFFGCIAALILLGLSIIGSLKYGFGNKRREVSLLLLFAVLVGNALLNIPSLELTSLYFIVLFVLLENPKTKRPWQKT